jgi:ubiquinone/menaquinone biosynthesis C-methylase UbiE
VGLEYVGGAYDLFMDVTERWGLGAWRTVLARRCRGRVLDIGCGTGRTLPLLDRADSVVGVDPSLGMLRRARRRAPGVPLVVGRAEALPFADGTFDTVISALVFCTVESPEAGLREVRRVLVRTGTLRMMEHVRSSKPWAARLQDLAQPAWSAISGGCHPNRATERQVEAAGFRIQLFGRRARRSMRMFAARPRDQPCTSTSADPDGSEVA